MQVKSLEQRRRFFITAVCFAFLFSLLLAIPWYKAEANTQIVISTAQELHDIRDHMEGNYILGNDIDLSGWDWEPIGVEVSNPFKGTFDGNGYTIKNLTSTKGGLFARTQDATFKNIKLENVNINTTHPNTNVGALAGVSRNGQFENITVDGVFRARAGVGGVVYSALGQSDIVNVHADIDIASHAQFAGGVVARGGNVKDSSATGKIYSEGFGAGGLVGEGSTIRNSNASVDIEHFPSATLAGKTATGGLAGYLNVTIEDSYATGNVKAKYDHVGGLVGSVTNHHPNKAIKNSYATGNVEGRYKVGGLIGLQPDHTSDIVDSYAKDHTVIGEEDVGGLVGHLEGSNSTVRRSFSESTVLTKGTATNVGGLIGTMGKYAKIEDTYARGPVTGKVNVGGLVGNNQASSIERSYATGAVNGDSAVGGLVGRDLNGNYSLNVAPNFYDEETTSQSDSQGATPKSTVELQTESTFNHWDFTNTWKLHANDYPILSDQAYGPSEPTEPTTPSQPAKPIDAITDVPAHFWGRDYVIEILDEGIMSGSPDPNNPGKFKFKPGDPITRAEFAIVLINALGETGTSTSTGFSDDHLIPDWAKKEVAKAKELGIVKGDNNQRFNPLNRISRAEMAVMIARAYHLELEGLGGPAIFEDELTIPDWAAAEVSVVYSYGIMQGRDRGGKQYFAPNADAQRVEAGITALRAYKLNK